MTNCWFKTFITSLIPPVCQYWKYHLYRVNISPIVRFSLEHGIPLDSRDNLGRCSIEAILWEGKDNACLRTMLSLMVDCGVSVFSVNPHSGRSVTEAAFWNRRSRIWPGVLTQSSHGFKVPEVLYTDYVNHHQRWGSVTNWRIGSETLNFVHIGFRSARMRNAAGYGEFMKMEVQIKCGIDLVKIRTLLALMSRISWASMTACSTNRNIRPGIYVAAVFLAHTRPSPARPPGCSSDPQPCTVLLTGDEVNPQQDTKE